MTARDGQGGRPSKVARLIDRYDLDGIGDELESLWTAEDSSERRSLRALAEYFNQEVLREVLADASTNQIAGGVESTYELLVSDGSTADRTRLERQLERDGVDVEALQSEFVTYQSMRTYLRSHRGAEYSADSGDQTEQVRESIQRLRGRTATVTESKLTQLGRTGALSLGTDVRATVDVRVICEDCGSQFGVQEVLDEGGCNCS